MMRRTSAVVLTLAALGVFVATATAHSTQNPPAKADPAKAGAAAQKSPEATKAGDPKAQQKPPAKAAAPVVPTPPVPPPPGYVIGPDDVLQVMYWRDKDISVPDVVVRPDGMISLPLLNEVKAAGLTPEQLREAITKAAAAFFEVDPNVTVYIKAINSRKVSITGSVAKPNQYPLTGQTTVLQLIAMAGGLTEFAKQKDISVLRTENGKQVRFPFNYKDVAKGKNLKQNIELKPGDTVIVP